jgi:hypothetical protein
LSHFHQGLCSISFFLFVFHSAPGWVSCFRWLHFGGNITEMGLKGNGPDRDQRSEVRGQMTDCRRLITDRSSPAALREAARVMEQEHLYHGESVPS